MRTALVSIALATCAILIFPARAAESNQNQSVCCQMVLKALDASRQIKTGMTRHEIEERQFVHGGGAYVPGINTYVYSKCAYIAIDIHFKLADPRKATESPNDVVTKASKPYLAYPAMD